MKEKIYTPPPQKKKTYPKLTTAGLKTEYSFTLSALNRFIWKKWLAMSFSFPFTSLSAFSYLYNVAFGFEQ